MTQEIERSSSRHVEQSARGDKGLRIDREGGGATRIMFRVGARPEEGDGA